MADSEITKEDSKKKGKALSGVVVSDKMEDTAVVAITRYVKHPKYKKFIKRVKKYHADDRGNKHTIGDKVTIREVKPISKRKHFKIEE